MDCKQNVISLTTHFHSVLENGGSLTPLDEKLFEDSIFYSVKKTTQEMSDEWMTRTGGEGQKRNHRSPLLSHRQSGSFRQPCDLLYKVYQNE